MKIAYLIAQRTTLVLHDNRVLLAAYQCSGWPLLLTRLFLYRPVSEDGILTYVNFSGRKENVGISVDEGRSNRQLHAILVEEDAIMCCWKHRLRKGVSECPFLRWRVIASHQDRLLLEVLSCPLALSRLAPCIGAARGVRRGLCRHDKGAFGHGTTFERGGRVCFKLMHFICFM